MRRFIFVALAVAVVLTLGGSMAQAGGREPGSLLVYPLYDSRPGVLTMITVTNTHPTEGVWVEYRYIRGDNCFKTDRTEFLTPNDTITVVAGIHNPDQNQGYLYVYAKEDRPSNSAAIVFNWLVGEASSFNGIQLIDSTYNAFSFAGIGAPGSHTDKDGDEWLDLDNAEYEAAADYYIQPRFFGQADGVNPGFVSEIVLINLTGGSQFTAEIDFSIYNDNEEPSSATWSFTCWDRKQLLQISGAFSATNLKYRNNQDEIVGFPVLEAGWFMIDGIAANSDCDEIEDPAILHMLIEHTGRAFGGAELPFESVGKQTNGDLLPRGCFGE
ncbi:MAG: hypothetical protein AB1486_25770 [Planctomycetota bacterium]